MIKVNLRKFLENKRQILLKKYEKTNNNQNVNNDNKKINSIIPLNLFQTWHTLDLPPKMKKTVELLQKQNPEFTYYLYDDDMCRNFIKDNFDDEIVYTFDKLKPGAYKADLWRYCILYIKGGIYLDIKYYCVNNFKLVELTDKEYFVKDKVNGYKIKKAGIYQALLSCLPKNNILLECIKQIVYNVKHNLYLDNPLCPTGPHLFLKFQDVIDIKNLELKFSGNYIEKNNNKILKIYFYYRREQKTTNKQNHYEFMWNNRNIYNFINQK
jgi:mannosyltransferase OCH1-like enzyme